MLSASRFNLLQDDVWQRDIRMRRDSDGDWISSERASQRDETSQSQRGAKCQKSTGYDHTRKGPSLKGDKVVAAD